MAIWDAISGVISGVLNPVKDVLNKREERRQAHESAKSALTQAQEANATTVTVGDQQLEHLLAQGMGTTWKDEYVTVSVVGIINAVMLGGILAGFGHMEFIQGVVIGVKTLVECGVEVGWILNATVAAAIGLNFWRKV